jgi:PHP family Zn ribbon phosphoesterase
MSRVVVDELQSVVAVLIGRSLSAEQVRDWSGVSWEQTRDALRTLTRRGIVRNYGAGHYGACQRTCATCERDARTLRGEAVCIDPESLRWFCEDCWNAEVRAVERIVG